ncbi:hypothetical protein FACS1894126_1820 [Alphaproteobacteria bacterium]|nr:hypothetical protein FACS1894126_1820 [Alphaproteobacteria bacterium]
MKKVIAALGVIGAILLPSVDATMIPATNAVHTRVVVEQAYEVANGFVGMNRDVIIRLIKTVNLDLQTRNILGMAKEIFEYRKQRIFLICCLWPRQLWGLIGYAGGTVITAFIKTGVDVNSRAYGTPALYRAAECSSPAAVMILLENGANPNIQQISRLGGNRGGTELHAIAHLKYLAEYSAMLQALVTHPETRIDLKNDNGDTALHIAARHGQPRLIATFCDVGHAAVNPKNNDGKTPLELASQFYECVPYGKLSLEGKDYSETITELKRRDAKYGYEL